MFKIISLLWLTGKKRQKILAELSYEGIDLENELAKIDNFGDNKAINLALLEIKKKYNKVNDKEYDKEKATILEEPWIDVLVNYNKENPSEGDFNLDWNDCFVDFLLKNGYTGAREEDIVKQWFDSLAENICTENGILLKEQV